MIYFLWVIYCDGFPSTSFDILDDVSQPLFHFSAAVEHTFKGHREPTGHTLTDPADKLYQQPLASQIKTQKEKENKTRGRANVEMISFTDGDSLNPKDSH